MTTFEQRRREFNYEQYEQRRDRAIALGRAAAGRRPVPDCPYPARSMQAQAWYGALRERQRELRRPARSIPPRPAGGQLLSQVAGMMCAQEAFQAWCGATDAAGAADYVRRVCGVQSRRELDTSSRAAQLFHSRIRRPYLDSRGA